MVHIFLASGVIMKVCRKYIVSGKVQGVSFRQNTQEVATDLGLKGWVQNLKDETVEVVAFGTEDELQALYKWLQEGPELAGVDNVTSELAEKESVENLSDFIIKIV